MLDALNLLNFGACDRRKILEEDKKRVRDRLLQKQRPKEAKYVLQLTVKSTFSYYNQALFKLFRTSQLADNSVRFLVIVFCFMFIY